MTLEKLLDLIKTVKNANDKIADIKFELWDNGESRLRITSQHSDGAVFTDYFNAVNFEELESILSQMLSL